jgi:hypothetical protein
MYAKIQPVSTFPSPSTVLSINNVTVYPGSSAAFNWYLLAAPEGAPQASGTITLDGEAYAAWGADDEYLYRFTAESLGLTIIEIMRDVAPAAPHVVTATDTGAAK